MMRSLYSGVAGLKTHQIKMDVIGNNIANVNTTAYKSQSITFTELMYQTTQSASGPNATTGAAGRNARQIGLGVVSGAINTAITSAGASQNTGNPFDIRITGDAFFIVNNAGQNFFTRDGSFYVDAAGNLATTANGYNVMGWGVNPETMQIRQDAVKPIKVLSPDNMTYPPEATTKGYVSGILDKNDTDAASSLGKAVSIQFFDNLGYLYNAKFAIKNTKAEGVYTVELVDILDVNNNSLKDVYGVAEISDIATFGSEEVFTDTYLAQLLEGVTYDNGKYYKSVGNSEAFSDFDTKKVSGVTYSEPTRGGVALGVGDALTEGQTVTMTGEGKISKDDLEEVFGLIYVLNNDPTVNGGEPYYYYKDSAGNEYTLGSTSSGTSAADWQNVLNKGTLNGFSAELDKDGNITFNFTQDFTVAGESTYDGASFTKLITQDEAYGVDLSLENTSYTYMVAPDGQAQITKTQKITSNSLIYDTGTGEFKSINGSNSVILDFSPFTTDLKGNTVNLSHFDDISIDFSASSMYNNNGVSTITMINGDKEGLGSGRKLGELTGVSIQKDGMIYASYDNGQTKLLGQIAVATFANASGLEKEGDNLYKATMNSGEFDGIGVDITANGGYMSTGVLEMSNVDLSSEFTEMITTQRGFQANSRIITVSDTLLEELINLKR